MENGGTATSRQSRHFESGHDFSYETVALVNHYNHFLRFLLRCRFFLKKKATAELFNIFRHCSEFFSPVGGTRNVFLCVKVGWVTLSSFTHFEDFRFPGKSTFTVQFYFLCKDSDRSPRRACLCLFTLRISCGASLATTLSQSASCHLPRTGRWFCSSSSLFSRSSITVLLKIIPQLQSTVFLVGMLTLTLILF